jgi:hypothetical protein
MKTLITTAAIILATSFASAQQFANRAEALKFYANKYDVTVNQLNIINESMRSFINGYRLRGNAAYQKGSFKETKINAVTKKVNLKIDLTPVKSPVHDLRSKQTYIIEADVTSSQIDPSDFTLRNLKTWQTGVLEGQNVIRLVFKDGRIQSGKIIYVGKSVKPVAAAKPVVAAKPVEKPEERRWGVWKKYPKEIKFDSWEKLVDNPVEYDYDVWDREKMKMVHLFKEEGIAIFKDDKGNYIWTNKNIQSNVKLIDKKLGLYIVTTYYMDHTGMFVKPSASPVQMSSKSEVGKAAYDKMWNDNWLSHHCLKTAYYRMLELEEELEDDSFGGRVD